MPTTDRHTNPQETEDEIIFKWRVHLARQHPNKLIVLFLAVAVAVVTAYYAVNPLASIVIAVVLTLSLADFLFPVRYELSKTGAVCKMLIKSARIEWKNVRRCYRDDFGVKLSPLGMDTRLEPFRGVYLRFANNEEKVIEMVKKMREDAR